MELDTERDLAQPSGPINSEVAAIRRDVIRGIDFYEKGDYVEALLFLTDAEVKLGQLEVSDSFWLLRDVRYYTYKAYAMSSRDPSRAIRLPITFLRLQDMIAEDGSARRRRAAKWYDRYGRVGLRAHDFLERRDR